jgi:hypothetical protein
MDIADALDCGNAIQETMILGTLTETGNQMTFGQRRRNPELEIPLASEFQLIILYYSV